MCAEYSTKGIVDLHEHAGPSVAPRSVDAFEMFEQTKAAGWAGFVLKEHYMPTTALAEQINKHLRTSDSDPVAFGCLCLNNSIGGLNTVAIDAAYCAGVKVICLPTVSALNHLNHHKTKFSGSGDMVSVEKPIYLLDESGKLTQAAKDVLTFLGERPELLVMTGHISVEEINEVVPFALNAGVKNLLVNHPHYEIGANTDDMKRWAEAGAYIELNACVFEGISRKTAVPLTVAAEMMEAVPEDKFILDGDLGQKHNDPPVICLPRFIGFLRDRLGVSDAYLDKVVKENPAKLVGLVK